MNILTQKDTRDLGGHLMEVREITPTTNLARTILQDLESIGMPTDFELDLRGYSKIYEGRYDSAKKLIILYVLEEDGEFLPYEDIIRVAIHECVHHIQWQHDPNFVRIKGVMHNSQFKQLLKIYTERYKNLGEESIC